MKLIDADKLTTYIDALKRCSNASIIEVPTEHNKIRQCGFYDACTNICDFINNYIDDNTRICDVCGEKMINGYVIADGLEYYCSDECLHSMYSKEEYEELCEQDLAYWTIWD